MQTIFERNEKKYILTPQQYHLFYNRIQKRIESDRYDHYTLYNLYYDTLHFDLIRNSIEKPLYKEKLRLRSYVVPSDDTMVFIELKKKLNHTVYKRRVSCTLKQAEDFLYHQVPLQDQQQIVHEIEYFLSFYQPIPRLFLAYERKAYHGCEDKTLRITFDSNIRYRTQHLNLRSECENLPYFQEAKILMEIKSTHAFPLWITQELSMLQLYPASFSKYGKIYTDCLFSQKQKENAYV